MSLYESRGNLAKGLKELILKWQYARTRWNDEQSEQIQTEVLEPLERDVRSAGDAMDTMKALIAEARRECQS